MTDAHVNGLINALRDHTQSPSCQAAADLLQSQEATIHTLRERLKTVMRYAAPEVLTKEYTDAELPDFEHDVWKALDSDLIQTDQAGHIKGKVLITVQYDPER